MDETNDLAEWCRAQGREAGYAAMLSGRGGRDRRDSDAAEDNPVADALADMVEKDRIDLIGPAVRAYFDAPYHIVTDSDSPRRYYAPRYARHRADTLTITFADDFKACPMTWAQCRSLLSIMPLFDATMRGDAVVLGSVRLNQWDAGVEPGLSYCANTDEYVLIPDPVYVQTRAHHKFRRAIAQRRVPWNERKTVALWRGATTDQYPAPPLTWRDMRRIRLSFISRAYPDILDAGITEIHHWDKPELRPLIKAENIMKPYMAATDFQHYRYQIDIDGSTNAWAGLFTKLLTGSTVMKVESDRHYRQWYYGRMMPWVHYVPVRPDMADLIGKIQWLRAHDDVAYEIGQRGQALAESMRYIVELQGAVEQINRAFRVYA
jgi:hypothetical protein